MTSFRSIGAVSDALCLDLMRKYDALQRSGRDDLDPNHENVVERADARGRSRRRALASHDAEERRRPLPSDGLHRLERIQRILTEELFKPDGLKIVEALKVVYKLDMSAAAASARGKGAAALTPAICRAALWRLAARRRVEGGGGSRKPSKEGGSASAAAAEEAEAPPTLSKTGSVVAGSI